MNTPVNTCGSTAAGANKVQYSVMPSCRNFSASVMYLRMIGTISLEGLQVIRSLGLSAALLAALSVCAAAQPAAVGDEPAVIRSGLPAPNLPADAKPSDFLRAAEGALTTGRKGEAQESLEEAQTRLLDRSVPLGQTRDPSSSPAVGQISQALQALRAGDRAACLQSIQAAIASTTAEGL